MDITENKALFRTVFDSASNGIAVLQPVYDETDTINNFKILLFNAYNRRLINDIEYVGKRYSEVFPAARNNGILQKFIKVAQTGITANFDCYHTGKGLKNWFSYTADKLDDFLLVTTQDITAQKQAEENLKNALDVAEKQKRLYDSITNNTPDLVYVFDLNYRFTYANKALLTMWGKSAEDAIGRGLRENGYEEWHALMHEREIDQIVASKISIRGTVSFPHAELGSRIYDYILVPVLNEYGEVEAVAGTTRDITEIKRAEDRILLSETRFRGMVDQTPAPTLILIGEDLVVAQINQSMLKMIGQTEEIIGVPLLTVMPELKGSYIWSEVLKVYNEGVPFDQREVLVTHKRTGEMRDYYYNIAYRPLWEEGKIIGMIQVAIDVTEQVLARLKIEESETRYKILSETLEQQVADRTTELQRSNEDLQQFAHVASHDLKEPVRKIKTFAGRLEQHLADKLDDAAIRFIERINVATDRMFTMIDGVLAYSTTNAAPQKSELVNLNEVVKNIEGDLEVALQRTGGNINYQNLPVVEGAEVLLYQLFYNLINNSIKFARRGIPPAINISSGVKDEGFAEITLEDNGIGFNPNHAEKIFETFTRLNPKDEYEGTGLGLSLCKKIAERHGGTITATGSVRAGAKFIITLPLQRYETGI
jgi:PAS domain S-box-containing protein